MEFQRVNISGGSSFEEVAGYSRIVKADPFVFVSGTTAVTPEGTVYGEGDPYAQAKYIFTKLVKLLLTKARRNQLKQDSTNLTKKLSTQLKLLLS